MAEYLLQASIYLAAAVIMVPIAKRLGLGSVLGYLLAGVVIGPLAGLVGEETGSIQHFAEFGVVMMLFLIGMELEPKALWAMRNRLLGLGGLQVGLTAAAVMLLAMLFGSSWNVALAIGLIFSLSSTAIILQTFNEKGLLKTSGGKSAFSVLLFQDIAVIPILAVLPLLVIGEAQVPVAETTHKMSLVDGLAAWQQAMVIFGAIASIVIGGKFLTWPIFKYVANSGVREIFSATALLLVFAIAAMMDMVGLSPALGTFLAGVVLANSEFKHELEANIEPFKGLLLGLFFITVGAGIDFAFLWQNLSLVLGLTLTLMLVKMLVLYLVARSSKVSGSDRWLFTLSLAQAGEFGFVLIGFAYNHALFDGFLTQLLLLVVALSMFLTPGLFIVLERLIAPKFQQKNTQQDADEIEQTAPVIIVGMGRFGQIVNRLLVSNGIKTVVLDRQAAQVENQRMIGVKSYFGDAIHTELLHTAGLEEASMFIVAIDDKAAAVTLVEYVRHHCPDMRILARAFDRNHAFQLQQAGASEVINETYYSALELGGKALQQQGFHAFHVQQQKHVFNKVDDHVGEKIFQQWQLGGANKRTNHGYRKTFIELEQAIKDAMEKDYRGNHSLTERGWTPPPKGYTDLL